MRRGGFIEKLYDFISDVSDFIIYTDNQINLSPQRKYFVSLFIAFKLPFQFQTLLLQKGAICKGYMHRSETLSKAHQCLTSCRENYDTRLVRFSNHCLVTGLNYERKADCVHVSDNLCTSKEEMASNRSLVSAQEKCHMACAPSQNTMSA